MDYRLIESIRDMAAEGFLHSAIAKELGVSLDQIEMALEGTLDDAEELEFLDDETDDRYAFASAGMGLDEDYFSIQMDADWD